MAEKNIEPVDVYEVVRDHMEKSCHRCRGDKVYRFMSESGAAGDWYLGEGPRLRFVPEVIAMKSNSDHFKNYVHVVELWPDEGRRRRRRLVCGNEGHDREPPAGGGERRR